MSKRSDPAAFARAAESASAAEPVNPAALPALSEEDSLPEPYDPAEYRWVPVRRKPRLDGWTEEKQRRFIETLADTGLVNVAAKAVGMSRASAYQLRRAEHGGAFARAWDTARHHAAGMIEDIVFERAIEGTEQEVLDSNGEVVATRLVHDNAMLRWLLSHLNPERYGGARARAAAAPETREPVPVLAESLRAMEPALPAPPEQLLDAGTLADELDLADAADGNLPDFLNEQRVQKSEADLKAEARAARAARGEAAMKKREAGGVLSEDEFADECYYFDPVGNAGRLPRRRQ